MNSQRVVKEVVSNYAIQLSNIVIPLISLSIGASLSGETFEIIAISLAFSTWGTLISDYGYSTLGVQRAARSSSVNVFRRRLTSGLLIKGLLGVTYTICVIFLVQEITDIGDVTSFSLFQFAGVVGAITPLWFLQGKRLLSKIFVVFVASRLLLLILFSFFVLIPGRPLNITFDYFAGVSTLAVNILILISVFRFLISEEGFRPVRPKWRDVQRNLKAGYHIAATSLLTTGYTVAAAPIITIVVSTSAGGYFFTAERIVQALKSISIPALIATLPYLAKIRSSGVRAQRNLLRNAGAIFVGSSILVLVMCLFVNMTIEVLRFDIAQEILQIFQILILAFPFVLISFFLGANFVLNTMGPKVYFRSYVWAFSTFFIFLPVLVRWQGVYGIAIASVIAEVVIAVIFVALSIRYARSYA